MKGKKRKLLSSVCAVFMAFMMIGQTVGGNLVSSVAASAGWTVNGMISGVKVDKEVYIVGQDTKLVVTFDVAKAVESGDEYYDKKVIFDVQIAKDNYFIDFDSLVKKEIPIKDLKAGQNTVEIPYTFPVEAKNARLSIMSTGDYEYMKEDVYFSIQKQAGGGSGGEQNVPYTDYWNLKSQVSNLKTDKAGYEMGSEQTVNVSFDVAKLPNSTCSEKNDDIIVIIADSSFSLSDLEGSSSTKGVIAYDNTTVSKLKGGTNTFSIKARFTAKGLYYVYVVQQNLYFTESLQVDFTVKGATDSSGNVIDTKASIRPQYSVYSAKQAATMKVFYTIDDSNSKYHLYIRKGLHLEGYEDYSADQKYVVADFMTGQDLPTEIGKELSVTLNKNESDFDYKGVYTAVLYNMTTKKFVAKQKFYVVLEKFVIQRDVTKMKDDGTIPFYCDADLRNFDMDKDENYSFQVCFPLNFKKYYQELGNTYDSVGYDDEIDDGEGPETDDLDNVFLSDDYKVNMTVSYVPEGSKDSRKLFKRKLTGMYKAHTVTLSSKEILKAIYDTGKYDIGYAGVVTVTFSNKDDYQDIANDAITRFTESFKFGVSKAESLVSVKPTSTKVELAYGEAFTYDLKDTLGGKIVQEIYKGKEMIDSSEGKCQIQSDGTASGWTGWDLKDSNGNYAEEGEYTAKVYTVNEYTYFEADGSTSQKKVVSEKKEISFNLVKPNRSLSVSAKVSGESGGNAVYVEKPSLSVVIKSNIGVSVIISVQSSNGVEIRNCSAVCGRGQKAVSMNLSGSRMKAGKYKVVVEAETLDGQKKKASAIVHVKKLPKSSIQNASVSANINTGLGTVAFKISEYADVTVVVKSGKSVLSTISGNHKDLLPYRRI